MAKQITRQQLAARYAANPKLIVLEALPEKYYVEGHLPGALHMPHDQVGKLARQLSPDLSAEIVVYCAGKTCNNSHIATNRLTQLGYTNVSVYAGGKQDWSEAGGALERAAATV